MYLFCNAMVQAVVSSRVYICSLFSKINNNNNNHHKNKNDANANDNNNNAS